MAQTKLPIKDILAAIDMGGKEVYDELTDEERKQISFWLLNRYVSSVSGSREKQELAIFKTNEYYNKNYMIINKHPKLMWHLMCLSGNTKQIEYHQWIGFKKKDGKGSSAGAIKMLGQIYPNMKFNEVEMLASMFTKKELKELAEEYSIEVKL